MTDQEISKALAIAIGWPYVDADFYGDAVVVGRDFDRRRFDYRDWAVAGPIAEKFDCFPYRSSSGAWETVGLTDYVSANTPQKAIALAVIGAMK